MCLLGHDVKFLSYSKSHVKKSEGHFFEIFKWRNDTTRTALWQIDLAAEGLGGTVPNTEEQLQQSGWR